MAIRYLQTGTDNDLPRHPTTTFDDDSAQSWWGGVALCSVQFALSAALLVSAQGAVARDQWTRDIQDPTGTNLHQPANEDYWQNPTAPVPATLYQQLPLTDVEQIPAGGLRGQPDEDFWPAQLLPVPVPATLGHLYLPDPDEIPAGTLHGQFDEDFWANPTPPVPGSNLVPFPWSFDEQTPRLFGRPDEDFWWAQLLPSPVPATLSRLYLPDPDEIPAASLHGQMDEDFWINPVAPVWTYPTRVFTDDDIIVPQPVTFQPDEDFWPQFYLPPPSIGSGTSRNIGFLFPLWSMDGDLVVTPAPPGASVLDERINYDKYGTGLYVISGATIGQDQ